MRLVLMIGVIAAVACLGCERQEASAPGARPSAAPAKPIGNVPPIDANNIVGITSASADHSTLVTALKAAAYVTSVAGSGPLTVFAPTNQAFDALPQGTVEDLLKPENVEELRNVLKYHVTTSALSAASFKDGQTLGMANGAKTTMHVDGDKLSINDAHIVASIPASNGIVHVIDVVLLPPAKK